MNKRACRVCGQTFGSRAGLGINMITRSEEDDTICKNCEEDEIRLRGDTPFWETDEMNTLRDFLNKLDYLAFKDVWCTEATEPRLRSKLEGALWKVENEIKELKELYSTLFKEELGGDPK